jgi:hypothetical protein
VPAAPVEDDEAHAAQVNVEITFERGQVRPRAGEEPDVVILAEAFGERERALVAAAVRAEVKLVYAYVRLHPAGESHALSRTRPRLRSVCSASSSPTAPACS